MQDTETFMKARIGDPWDVFAKRVLERVDAKLDAQTKALIALCLCHENEVWRKEIPAALEALEAAL